MVLGGHVALDALALGGTPSVDVLARVVTSDERDRLDLGRIEDAVDSIVGTVDHREDAIRDTSLLSELGEDH